MSQNMVASEPVKKNRPTMPKCRHVIAIIASAIAWPAASLGQTVGIGTGVMLPIGENRGISDRGQSVLGTLAMATPFFDVATRLDIAYARARSRIVAGAGARTFVISATATKPVPRIPAAYLLAGMGAYRSSLYPAPFTIKATSDFGLSGGAGLRMRLGSRMLGRSNTSSGPRLNVFLESRLHHILSDVKPTDYIEVSVGARLLLRGTSVAP